MRKQITPETIIYLNRLKKISPNGESTLSSEPDIPTTRFVDGMLINHTCRVKCPFCGEDPDIWCDTNDYTVHVACKNHICGNDTEVVSASRKGALYGWYDVCQMISDRYEIEFPRI